MNNHTPIEGAPQETKKIGQNRACGSVRGADGLLASSKGNRPTVSRAVKLDESHGGENQQERGWGGGDAGRRRRDADGASVGDSCTGRIHHSAGIVEGPAGTGGPGNGTGGG